MPISPSATQVSEAPAVVVSANTSSPDSYSSTSYFYVGIPLSVMQALFPVFGALTGRSGRPAVESEPVRQWWPSEVPDLLRRWLFDQCLSSLWIEGEDLAAKHRSLFASLGRGEWVYHTSVPEDLKEKLRLLATEPHPFELGHSIEHREDWEQFFGFLLGLGVKIEPLTRRESFQGAEPPSFDPASARLAIDVFSDGVQSFQIPSSPVWEFKI